MADETDGRILFASLFENGDFSDILKEDEKAILNDLTKEKLGEGHVLSSNEDVINKYTYVVESGSVELYFADNKVGEKRTIRTVRKGECIYSIFSIADTLTGNDKHFYLVHAKTLEPTVLHKLPNERFLELANRNHKFALKLIQITLSNAQKIRDIIYSISGLGPKIWKRTEFKSGEGPVDELPFGNKQLEGEDTSIQSTEENNGGHDVHQHIENLEGAERLNEKKKDACRMLMKTLKLNAADYEELLLKYISVYQIVGGTEIIKAERRASDIVLVVEDTVYVTTSKPTESDTENVIKEPEGSLLGVYSAINGEMQRYQIKAGEKGCIVAVLSYEDVQHLCKTKCEFAVRLCDYKLRQLSPTVRFLDIAINWESVQSGKTIERNKDSLFYVKMGRLRKEITENDSDRNVSDRGKGDFSRGSIIGAEDILFMQDLEQKLHAVRDSRVARIPVAICDYFMKNYPEAVFEKIRHLLKSLKGTSAGDSSHTHGISNVACIKVSDDVPLEKLVERIGKELRSQGIEYCVWDEKSLNNENSRERGALDETIMKNKMNSLENDNDIDFYLANYPSDDWWSQLIIGQADLILIFGVFENGYNADQHQKLLRKQRGRYSADEMLLLLHKPNKEGKYDKPKDTWKWLRDEKVPKEKSGKDKGNDTEEVSPNHQITHLHIRCPKKMFPEDNKDEPDKDTENNTENKKNNKDEPDKGKKDSKNNKDQPDCKGNMNAENNKDQPEKRKENPKNNKDQPDGKENENAENNRDQPDKGMDNKENEENNKQVDQRKSTDDFARLFRYIFRQSYGLVLGGGGARGFAHVGVIKRMKEEKVPIDMVGGTSMGAFVGACYCMTTEVEDMENKTKNFSEKMISRWRYLDLTLPYASISSGTYFNNQLIRIFRETDFEDLWIPYFNITTDITDSKKVVNTRGPLWEYVRASMSLAAIVPPLCDPYNGHYLLDGGSVDNLPAREMKERGCKTVVAIDVGGKDTAEELRYGSSVPAWWLFLQRYNPWSVRTVPDILTVVTKLACVSGEEELKRVKEGGKCHNYIYKRPENIDNYGTLQFEEYANIKELGYGAAADVVKDWNAIVSLPVKK